MRRLPVTGALLVASAVLSLLGYAILGTQFGWPAVLDEPGTAALDRFVAAEQWVRAGFYLFLLSSLLLVPGAIAVQDGLTRGQTAARAITAFGVLGAFAQMLGWVRWPLTVPRLADRWTDPAATDADLAATAAVYDLVNGYAGGALGEHLGWLLQGVWAVGASLFVLRARPAAVVRPARGRARHRLGRPRAGRHGLRRADAGVLEPQRLHRLVPVAARPRGAADGPSRRGRGG